jgi:valyl-tRNA synthetase
MLREVARAIQDLRQKAGYRPSEKITVAFAGLEEHRAMLEKHNAFFEKEAGVKEVLSAHEDLFDAEGSIAIDGGEIKISVRRA